MTTGTRMPTTIPVTFTSVFPPGLDPVLLFFDEVPFETFPVEVGVEGGVVVGGGNGAVFGLKSAHRSE